MTDMIQRKIKFPGQTILSIVDLNNPVIRYNGNPLITAEDVNRVWKEPQHKVTTIHNAGVVQTEDGFIMLFRSHLRCGISVIGIARSKNGVENWIVDSKPALVPANNNDNFAEGTDSALLIENESGGLEDPRIICLGNEYAVVYSAYHSINKNRVRVSLSTTEDFNSFTRHGPILDVDMRNVVIFPEKIGDKYVALFRPNDVTEGDVGGIYSQIRIGYSDDWKKNNWNVCDDPLIRTGYGPSAFSDKIGPCAPPLKTKNGWVNIFHGVRTTMDGNPYVLGVALHDLNDPASVKVSSIPILFPSASDCIVNTTAYVHVPNVVFCCGAVSLGDGRILIYYGGSDTVMNVAITHEDVLAALCENYGQHPATGQLLYEI